MSKEYKLFEIKLLLNMDEQNNEYDVLENKFDIKSFYSIEDYIVSEF